jgi:predicted ABC-type ATPase
VPEHIIRRRYIKGVNNFFNLYRPLADTWVLYDNSVSRNVRRVARGGESGSDKVFDEKLWLQFREAAK